MSCSSHPASGWQPASVKTMVSPWAARTPAFRWCGMETVTPGGRWKSIHRTVGLVALPYPVEPLRGRVDDHDLEGLAGGAGLGGDRGQRAIEARLILADDDDRDHRWNTSDEPSV